MDEYTGKDKFPPDGTTTPGLSIVVPTHQGAGALPAVLAALSQQEYPAPVEVIAVDSGSTDETLSLLEQFGAAIIRIPSGCFGHGYVRNLGVRQARQPIVVFLSQDAIPVGTRWLQALIEPLRDPATAATYARQLPRPGATPLEVYFQERLYPAQSRYYSQLPGSDAPASLGDFFFSNVASAARREICLAFPFDETLIMSEDQAFAKGLLKAGYQTFYNADAPVIHSHAYSLPGLFRRHFDSAYSLRGVVQDDWTYLLRSGMSYIAGEIAYLIRIRAWAWLLMVPAYEAARIAGRVLGRYADRLPYRIRLACSLHRSYWRNSTKL